MNQRKIDIFLSGLCMDGQVLQEAGMQPANLRRALMGNAGSSGKQARKTTRTA